MLGLLDYHLDYWIIAWIIGFSLGLLDFRLDYLDYRRLGLLDYLDYSLDYRLALRFIAFLPLPRFLSSWYTVDCRPFKCGKQHFSRSSLFVPTVEVMDGFEEVVDAGFEEVIEVFEEER
jgi:hypothetical protein